LIKGLVYIILHFCIFSAVLATFRTFCDWHFNTWS